MSAERRMQFMLPDELHAEHAHLPLVFLPIGPLEWHGLHLAIGMDPINAEQVAVGLADRVGGVVHPTLYMGTERERGAPMLKSLGFHEDVYMVGMDFPSAVRLYRSFYFSEELFALVVRAHLEQFLEHGYTRICLVNGHGATNHNEVLRRLCIEFSQRPGIKACFTLAFPTADATVGSIAHAGSQETSLLMHYVPRAVDLKKLPPDGSPLTYAEHGIVDSGGFSGSPGPNFTVPAEFDPREQSSADQGKRIFARTLAEVEPVVRRVLDLL